MPPVLEIEMPFMVFGTDAIVLLGVCRCCEMTRARNGKALSNDMQLCKDDKTEKLKDLFLTCSSETAVL